ncbi:hypothetical protein AAZX31_09G048100 [Glycine max]
MTKSFVFNIPCISGKMLMTQDYAFRTPTALPRYPGSQRDGEKGGFEFNKRTFINNINTTQNP